ncbi:uncharacterized protein Dana_GF26301 [Drosophila ananassae]|uniref:Uncharacterized protein n=1 Tax=Drosophila ananassae TaxID=7217 RepID=A0A0P8Y6W0_DROAN|nr:uncharacterized protein LOC26513710 [Drosophila ananassae]KAH8345323.1 hypothetical protein KR067_005165 [Drosophila pandora]KPU74995.1 uncharacterized protein Dana_GF26301 [Drosophila ananassae]
MDGDQLECRSASSEQELAHSRCRRKAVHFASVGDFLSSLNINDTSLSSLQGLRTLTLEDYLRSMRNPERMSPSPPGDGNRRLNGKAPRKMRLGREDFNRQREPGSRLGGSPDEAAYIPQYTDKFCI